MIGEEVQKTEPKPTVAKAEPETTDVKIEVGNSGLIIEEIENQNNVEDDLGIKAEALYDYQAGSLKM